MFKFLFRNRGADAPAVTRESQRQTLERALGEVNEIVDGLDPKPKVTLDPTSGHLSLAMPEQFPDEARALPAPDGPSPTPPKAEPPKPNPPAARAPEPKRPEPKRPEPRVPSPRVPEPKSGG